MRRIVLLATVLSLGTIVAAIVIRLVRDVAPLSDFALIDIHVISALRAPEAAGAYSRFGWGHPGPLYFQVLAPLYWLSGFRHLAIIVMAAALNSGAVLAVLFLIRRYAHQAGLLVATIAMFAIYFVRVPDLIGSPWNAHVPVLSLALTIVAASAAAAGAAAWLPVMVFAASLAIQAHAGAALCAVAVVAATFVVVIGRAAIARRRTGELPQALPRAMAIALVLGLLVWALPFADVISSGRNSNLGRMYDFFRSSKPVASRTTDRVFAHYLIAPFTPDLHLPFGARLEPAGDAARWIAQAQGIALIVTATVWTIRRRRFEAALATMILVADFAALIAARRLPEEPLDHTLFWISVLGVLSWTTILAGPADAVWSRVRSGQVGLRAGSSRVLTWGLGSCAMAVLLLAVGDVFSWYRYFERDSSWVLEATAIVKARMNEASTRSVLFRIDQRNWGLQPGVALQLYREGIQPTVVPSWVSMYGEPFKPTGHELVTIQFAQREEHLDELRWRTDYRALGSTRDMYFYSIEPAAAHVPFTGTLRIVETFPGLGGDARALLDRVRSTPSVIFDSAEAYLTIELPKTPMVGLRLWGEGSTLWQLRCSGDDGTFRRIGRVRIGDGYDVQSGETFITDLPNCRQLKIAPAQDHEIWWLTEIELFVRSQ
jgi:hypothetical protein